MSSQSGAAAATKALVRCTRRIRDPLNYLVMQPTDPDQVTTSIRTADAAMVTWFVPLHNLQYCLHKRYEAEQFGVMIVPKGVAVPEAKPLTPTEDSVKAAAARRGPSVVPRFMRMTAPRPSGAADADAGAAGSSPASSPSRLSSSPSLSEGGNQLNNYVNEDGDTVVPLGLVTMIVGNNIPAKQSWVERLIDPAPHPTLSMRVMVVDRIHWQRTSWLAGSICSSLCWGRLPQRIFSINLDYKNPVYISGGNAAAAATAAAKESAPLFSKHARQPLVFDKVAQRYTSPFQIDVPGLNFRLKIEDTGKTLFDTTSRVVDGFLDNESALHRLALSREVNMLGLGGSVYRQTLWSSPSLPNVGRVVECEFGSLFERYFGCSPVGDPVATWLVDAVDKTLIYQMEGEVEDENDPNSATTYGDRSLTERVQKKAMNRYNNFRDDIRHKTYSELAGDEVPR
ncbi:conserved hypothetical protein [Leishmania major strain Friedlin]|uniref:Uncharacterized protein n=1 Tax=Leishmania major TaxID=5664 RepID=Q4QBN1_LEIMA|nr:conserved hypothetical protein [Leishmania major strain Friedlin]CAG9573982.1 hypothetical_protein_-_conserved [Leishmania major strain Friedlin]CAJ04552.1 conserved hypothetical protein [Leishmania major strain Friedlin]|eukprot:XP_001683267.1 conserved hypothetical protein [Leishmania major strain Friedlin]